MVGGLALILSLGGYVLWSRKTQAEEAEPAPPARRARSAPPKKAAPEPEKESLFSKLGVVKKAEPEEKKNAGPTDKELKDLEGLIKAGHIDDAARVAMRLQLWDKAAQLYLKAEQPGNAAHCAKRAGKFEMAAEFYEKAGEVESAVRMWEKAGNTQRARELAGTAPEVDDEDSSIIQISKELQAEIDAAIEKKDHMRAAELFEQAGDKENAAEQFAAFAQTARRPEVYAEKIQALSPRVAYNMLRIAQKGRKPDEKSAELYRRLAMLQHHFNNPEAAKKTLKRLLRAVPEDEEAQQMLREMEIDEPPSVDSQDGLDDLDGDAAGAESAPGAESPKSSPRGSKDVQSDGAIEAARDGPSIADLVSMIGNQPCDLGNIEVYYRLGMACLAANKVADALKAFQAVDGVSPGYRDTSNRIAQLK